MDKILKGRDWQNRLERLIKLYAVYKRQFILKDTSKLEVKDGKDIHASSTQRQVHTSDKTLRQKLETMKSIYKDRRVNSPRS